ncbi:MAG: replication initiation protein [Desulfobacterales bacterium]|nr:replication initiation protein [Desulfobacterales bacterium]
MSEGLKQDMNFLEYPLWFQNSRLATHQDDGYVWRGRDGFVYRTGYKPPTKTDYMFLCYLLLMSQQAAWQSELETTRYEVVKACGMVPGKKCYDRLEDCLTRWKMVGLEFRGIFYDGNEYDIMQFGVIDDWDIHKKSKKLRVKFNKKWLLCIKESTFFKFLDLKEIKQLHSALSIRLYEILIKTFQGRDVWKIDAGKLAGKIPLAKKYASHIVLKILAALKQINKHTSLDVSLTVRHPERGRAVLIFKKNKPALNTKKQNETSDDVQEKANEVLTLIPNQHRSDNTTELVSYWVEKRGFDYVRRNIEYTNERSCKQNGYRGYLANAFEQDWAGEHPRQTNSTHNIQEGMAVEYKGDQYRVDAMGCIFLPDGACMPPGLVRQKLDAGEFKVIS